MSVQMFPSGISVTQAKKDAKKLAKSSGLQLSEAQNLTAFKHGRTSWAALVNQLSTQNSLSLHFNQGEKKLNFPKEKSFTIVEGVSGSGKSVILIEAAAQMNKAGYPVVYLTCDLSKVSPSDLAGQAVIQQQKTNPDLFLVYDFLDEDLDLASFWLNGSILIIDEIAAFFEKYSSDLVNDLLKASKHTIVACQEIRDIDRHLSNCNISNECIQMLFLNDVKATHFGQKIERERGKFVEFLAVNDELTHKFSLSLNEHQIIGIFNQ
ncbi:ATP-binding protein [Shewanella sp. BF02_Schw]|uniref:ATP-binding protein n=1 Tax=Shewanella sp. BF02_Schw TaxID=394908 RepID=UPI00178080D2|nr:ATP-binding protein [Shewanella sp. BF02_Schw]MBO1897591.1 ATP-binding protein [Shewanella sp. BF02_Schw]